MKTKLCLFVIVLALSTWLGADVFYVSGNISSNSTWEFGDTYVLTGVVKVLNGVNLTIASGVEVHFEVDSTLEVEGSIQVLGTSTAPVVFKPQAIEMFADRRYTNILLNGAENSSFSHCHFSYANHPEGLIRIVNSHSVISFNNCTINVNDGGNGIFLYNDSSSYDSTLNLSQVQINSVNQNGIYIHGTKNQCTFTGLTVNSCTSAISIYEWHTPAMAINSLSVANSSSYLTVMRLSHYHDLPLISISNPSVPFFYANGYNTLYDDLTLSDQSQAYLVKYPIYMYNATDLVLEAGCELAFEQYGKIEMRGGSTLSALGSSELPIVFKSKDGNTTWGGIYFEQNCSATLDYCNFIRSGYSNEYGHFIPSIQAERNTNISISNSTINASNSYAIECLGSGGSTLALNNVILIGAAVAGIQTANSDLNFSYQDLTIQNCGVPIRIPANLIESLDSPPVFINNSSNHITIFSNGNIYRNTTFRNLGLPYRCEVSINSNYVEVNIEAGVIFQFGNELNFSIRGSLNVNGTSENPVLFTRLPESTGYWMGFYLSDACTSAIFSWVNFSWAASPQYGNRNVIHIYRADSVVINNCTMTHLNGTGIYTESAHTTDSLTINNLSISDCAGDGLYLSSTDQNISISGVILQNVAWYPLSLPSRWIHQVQDVVLSENVNQVIQLLYGNRIEALPFLGYPYLVSSSLTVDYGANVVFAPGNTLWLGDGVSINVYGNLFANGTEANPLVLGRREGSSHYWQSINLYNNSTADFSHCLFSHGAKDYPYGDLGLIQNNGASSCVIDTCSISNIQEQAIRMQDASSTDILTINSLSIAGAATDGIYIDTDNPEISITGLSIASCQRHPISLPFKYLGNIVNLQMGADKFIRVIRSGIFSQNLSIPDLGYPIQVEVDITQNAGYTLSIAPGITFWMVGERYWNIYGSFSALGTELEPIVFTRKPGNTDYWQGLRFYNSCPLAEMTYTQVLYAGYNQYDHSRYAILNEGANMVNMQHCLIDQSYGHGVKVVSPYVTDTFTLENCTISNVGMNGFNSETDPYNLSVNNLLLEGGVGYPIYVRADLVDKFANITASGFAHPYFAFWGYQINHNAIWPDHGFAYLSRSSLEVMDGKSLTLEAGVHLIFADYIQYQNDPTFSIYGSLSCNGTIANPILISGLNPEGGSTWNGITFYYPDSPCSISYTNISNAGMDEQHAPSDEMCALYAIGATVNLNNCTLNNATYHQIKTDSGSTLNISDCTIQNAGGKGIWMLNGSVNMIRSSIWNCATAGVFYEGGSFSPSIWNKIYGNVNNLYNNSLMPLSASHIWWGSTNPSSIDSLIFDDEEGKGMVNFEPWYGENLSQLYFHTLLIPQNISLTLVNGNVLHLQWDEVPGALHYEIQYSENPEADTWEVYSDTVIGNAIDISLDGGDMCFFRVVAKN